MNQQDNKPFDQLAYIKEWNKKNLKHIKVSYRDSFVDDFRTACKKLGISQSSVFKQAMQEVIDKAKEVE